MLIRSGSRELLGWRASATSSRALLRIRVVVSGLLSSHHLVGGGGSGGSARCVGRRQRGVHHGRREKMGECRWVGCVEIYVNQ